MAQRGTEKTGGAELLFAFTRPQALRILNIYVER